jgi:hypothetical protein
MFVIEWIAESDGSVVDIKDGTSKFAPFFYSRQVVYATIDNYYILTDYYSN